MCIRDRNHSEPDFKPTRLVTFVHGTHGVDQETADRWEAWGDWQRKKSEPVLEVSAMAWSPAFSLFRDPEGRVSRIDGFQIDTLFAPDPFEFEFHTVRSRLEEHVLTFTDWYTGRSRSWLLCQAHSPITGGVAKVVWYEPFTLATDKKLVH